MQRTKYLTHPIAEKLGLLSVPHPQSQLHFHKDPDSDAGVTRVEISHADDGTFSFTVLDETRRYGATFDHAGLVLSLTCSAGIPAGDTAAVVELFCEEARIALQSLVIFH